MRILVTDGEQRSALAATRSLGRKGCHVIVCSKSPISLSSSSRYCHMSIMVPDPLSNGTAYLDAIYDIVLNKSIDVIFPMTEQSIHLLNIDRSRLPENTVLACPTADLMLAVSDKAHLFRSAESLNVPIPKTFYVNTPDDLSSVISQIEHYPVVVKPSLSRRQAGEHFLSGGVKYADSKDDLQMVYASNNVLRYPSIIQERVVGPGMGLFTLYAGNHHLALFSHKRLREKPPSGGVSVVSESVPLDDEMVVVAGRLLSAVGWNGVAMVEFKRDQRDGKAKLIEINGRFWGSLQLAIACGIDFPSLLLDHLQGINPTIALKDYRVGHKLKWFLGTLDHLLIRLKHSEEELNLPPGSPSKWQAVLDFLKVCENNMSFDVFDRDDPAPFWFEARSYFHML